MVVDEGGRSEAELNGLHLHFSLLSKEKLLLFFIETFMKEPFRLLDGASTSKQNRRSTEGASPSLVTSGVAL